MRTAMNRKPLAITFAILAAALYAINVPFSKLMLGSVGPTMMAAFLYLGAGLGMTAYTYPHAYAYPRARYEAPHPRAYA